MIRGNDMLAYASTARMYTVENAQFIAWPPPQQQQTGGNYE
jgi:hypothetical protein